MKYPQIPIWVAGEKGYKNYVKEKHNENKQF